MFFENDKMILYFGDKQSCSVDYNTPEFLYFCEDFAKKFGISKVLFNKQVHGANGVIIDSPDSVNGFKNIYNQGDFLITDQKSVGVGVLTADCLPILVYDPKKSVIASIHAGWRSSVLKICLEAFQKMNQRYGSQLSDLQIFFGPCAKVCCYQVQQDFASNLFVSNLFEDNNFTDSIVTRNGKMFFDNTLLNAKLITQLAGQFGKLPNLNYDYNMCTICNHNFYSYRRDKQTTLRQISFIALK